MKQLSRKISDEMKYLEPLVRVFRFYVVLRRFNYIDPLIYSTNKELIKRTIDEALKKNINLINLPLFKRE